MKTSERLAQALHAAALFDLEARAHNGEFSDFESPHAMPKVVLVQELQKLYDISGTAKELAELVMNGEYDDTKEEANAWYQREGKHLVDPNLK